MYCWTDSLTHKKNNVCVEMWLCGDSHKCFYQGEPVCCWTDALTHENIFVLKCVGYVVPVRRVHIKENLCRYSGKPKCCVESLQENLCVEWSIDAPIHKSCHQLCCLCYAKPFDGLYGA